LFADLEIEIEIRGSACLGKESRGMETPRDTKGDEKKGAAGRRWSLSGEAHLAKDQST